jgi:hypothetical protein
MKKQYEVIRHGKNVHEIKSTGGLFKMAMFSDLHWDNPKCDRASLKKDLNHCLENNIPIHINGDLFCLMQGRGDRRSNKSDILPEHNNAFYIDSVINTAVDWFSPYAHLITVVGYGNHETGIIKWQETDVLQRFVDLLNSKNNTQIYVGGYGGWVIVSQQINETSMSTSKIKYYHGTGGGGIVTKGAINLTRALETYEDFDVFTMGHIHENSCRNDVRDTLKHSKLGYSLEQKQLHLMITGSYKEEYGDGSHGWHVERGAPVKPVGGRILQISTVRIQKDNIRQVHKQIDSYKFPI